MKKIHGVTCKLLTVLMMLSLFVAIPINIKAAELKLSNSNFEEGNLNGWNVMGGDATIVSNGHQAEGDFAAKFTRSGVSQYAWNLLPNTTYTVKVKGKRVEETIDARLYVKYYGGEQVDSPLNIGEYGTTSVTFTTGSTNTSCEFGIWVWSGKGEVYVDDFQLIEEDDFIIEENGEKWTDSYNEEELMTEENFLKANGLMFKNNSGNGDEVILRGVNLGGWLVREPWMDPVKNSADDFEIRETLETRFGAEAAEELIYTYQRNWITTYDLDNIKNMGFNCVRVPFWYRNLQNEDGTWIRKENGDIDFSALDWIVTQCSARGIYVVLDLHGTPGFQSNAGTTGKENSSKLFEDSEEGEGYRKSTIELWVEVAKHFNNNPAVAAYDLINEPMGLTSNRALWDLYDRIYDAIRQVDENHIIMMEAIWDWNNLPNPVNYGWENISYQLHNYDYDNVWNFEGQKAFTDFKIEQAIDYRGYNVPLFIGEFNGMALNESWQYILDEYNKNGLSWTTWSYKICGYSSWGLMCNNTSDIPDINIDSYEDIKSKWIGFKTEKRFFENTSVVSILKEAAKAEYPSERYAPITTESIWLNGSSDEFNYTAGNKTTVSKSNEVVSGTSSAKFITTISGFPGNENSCIKIKPDVAVNATSYTNIILSMKGTLTESHYVTLYDAYGRKWEGWISAKLNPSTWTKVIIPLSAIDNGFDISKIVEIRIGEWNAGTYYVDDIYLAKDSTLQAPSIK